MIYKFLLPIGDWSGDGHDKCAFFTVLSNKPVTEVREIHFQGCAWMFDIHSILNEYGESMINADQIPPWALEFFESDECLDPETLILKDPPHEHMARLWAEMLRRTDPTLEIKVLDNPPEMLPFYGYDGKGRHIRFVGYGLFE